MGHFVLVHGACHGAWCWYKVKPVLEKEGHWVTAVDLAASGINMAKIEEVHTMSDYTEPLMELMESLPPEEKVILVGHSLGGLNVALVMNKFPEKISVAVFLTAHMPDCVHPPSFVLDEFYRRLTQEFWLDSQISSDQHPLMPKNVIALGPKCMASKLYQHSPSQDLALAKLLTRHGSSFDEDQGKGKPCSEERYGTVNRVFIVCGKDLAMTADFQRWMIENNPVKDVMEIEDADHMAMLSKPRKFVTVSWTLPTNIISLVSSSFVNIGYGISLVAILTTSLIKS